LPKKDYWTLSLAERLKLRE